MSTVYQILAERIRAELTELDQIIARAQKAWEQARVKPEEFAYLDSVALNLHAFYSGVERLFELIARHIDEHVPSGATWHRNLLRQMATEMPERRPAVIHPQLVEDLDLFRRFRHLVRNVYTFNLRPERVAFLMERLIPLWKSLRSDLLLFSEFLEALHKGLETS